MNPNDAMTNKCVHNILWPGRQTFLVETIPDIMFLIKKRRSADAHHWTVLYQTDKNSHQRCSIKKGVSKNFTIFTGQESPVLKPLLRQGWNKVILYLEETPTQMFPCEYCKISSNNCFEEHRHTATSENNKNIFLRKATNHNDHYMINI